MNDLDGFRTRHLTRVDRLRALEAEPDAKRFDSKKVGEVLEAFGAVHRRSTSLGVDPASFAQPLRRLDSAAVSAWVEAIDVEGCEKRLRRAADEAIEAALPEMPNEGPTWAEWALQGLAERDELESAWVALEELERMGVMDTSSARGRLGERLRRMDRNVRAKARWFVGLNRARRAERDLLAPKYRERAWWYVARVDCDELLRTLGGELDASGHLEGCDECRRDLESTSAAVSRRRTRHLGEEELWKYDLGLLSAGERAAVEQHARACVECGRAVRALSEGEEAIREAEPVAQPARAALAPEPAPPMQRARSREAAGRVLLDRADFRVDLGRREGRVFLRVSGRGAFGVGFASAHLSGAPPVREPAAGRATPIELELGSEEAVLGRKVRLVIEARDHRTVFDADVQL
jgi:hypothetical protein